MLAFKLAAAALTFAAVAAVAAQANANCAMPIAYDGLVTGNTVTITPTRDATCPQPGGMLRQNPTSGEIVELADFCGDANGAGIKPYVDECVPVGTYRYGFATPFSCDSSACNVDYYVEILVESGLSDTCTRSAGNSAPAAATSVPWKDDPTICSYQEDPCWNGCPDAGTGGSGGTTTGTATDGGDYGNDETGSSGGCSVGVPAGAAPVLGANVAALLAGLALMRRRAKRA
jgi:hypothetical protein